MLKLRNERADGVIISTIEPSFMAWFGKFETASVTYFHGREIISILRSYETEEDARKGHEEFLRMSSEELQKVEPIG